MRTEATSPCSWLRHARRPGPRSLQRKAAQAWVLPWPPAPAATGQWGVFPGVSRRGEGGQVSKAWGRPPAQGAGTQSTGGEQDPQVSGRCWPSALLSSGALDG